MADAFAGVVMLLVAAGVFAQGLSTIGFINGLISIATSFGSASIILMLVFNSCSDLKDGVILQDDESIVLSPEEYVSVAYDTPKTISTQQAVDIVRNFSLQNSTRSSVYPTVINKKELSSCYF